MFIRLIEKETNMKRLICLLALPMLLIASCDDTDNYGYPSKVSFGREGGTITVMGDYSFYNIAIRDYDGNGKEDSYLPTQNDTLVISYQWLTVKALSHEHKIILIAEPNNEGSSRKLYVTAAVDNFDAEIKVTQ